MPSGLDQFTIGALLAMSLGQIGLLVGALMKISALQQATKDQHRRLTKLEDHKCPYPQSRGTTPRQTG